MFSRQLLVITLLSMVFLPVAFGDDEPLNPYQSPGAWNSSPHIPENESEARNLSDEAIDQLHSMAKWGSASAAFVGSTAATGVLLVGTLMSEGRLFASRYPALDVAAVFSASYAAFIVSGIVAEIKGAGVRKKILRLRQAASPGVPDFSPRVWEEANSLYRNNGFVAAWRQYHGWEGEGQPPQTVYAKGCAWVFRYFFFSRR